MKKGVDAHALKEQMLELLQARGAQYPAEHNVGHLYKAPETLTRFYRENDPTNSMNRGSVKPVSRNSGKNRKPDKRKRHRARCRGASLACTMI